MKIPTIALIYVLGVGFTAKAQSIDSAMANFKNASPFEKAYIQFDNNKYVSGQTIWYKAYLMSGFGPSLISKTFYIDWYDDLGNRIGSSATPIIYCYSTGSFALPSQYHGKFVYAIGYTKWMRNFDSSYFFHQRFPIVGRRPEIRERDIKPIETSVQFLPESGTLLSNRPNSIAFKAVNDQGLPENIKGLIRNGKGDSITLFKSIHDGMGKFWLTPVLHEKYTAEWKDKYGRVHQNDLPLSEETGISLIIEPGRFFRKILIQRTEDVPDRMYQLTLIGQMNGAILFKKNVNLFKEESVVTTLPISKLLSGVLQLTVFDANMEPLCERVIFVKNEDYLLNTSIQIDTLNILRRGKNTIEIEVNDTTYSNLSLSVTDGITNESPDNTILSQLMLKGEIGGNVYNAGYYFASNADSVDEHLDLVMLTNGWRRYNWGQILTTPRPVLKYEKDSGYQTIQGKIKDYTNKKSKNPDLIKLIFVSKDSSSSMLTLPIRPDGSFSGKNAIFYDTTKIYVQTKESEILPTKDYFIENDLFKGDPSIHLSTYDNNSDAIVIDHSLLFYEQQQKADSINNKNTLKEVIVLGKQKSNIKQLDALYATGVFSYNPVAAFDMSTLENASHNSSLFDFLMGKVNGLTVTNTFLGRWVGEIRYRGGELNYFLDEQQISIDKLYNIDMQSVAYIKVFSPPFVGGSNRSGWAGGTVAAGGGAIAIYSKRGKEEKASNNLLSESAEYKTLAGYTPVKEFYTPNYAEKDQSSLIIDQRSTLLWEPWINLDKEHPKIKISFYNNDISHSFRLILEGMDGKGKLVHINKLLK